MFTFLSTRITFIVPQVARDQKIISLGDFSANINPQDSCSDELVVGPYGCWKRPTNDNELRLLNLCSQFSLVLTNTLNEMKPGTSSLTMTKGHMVAGALLTTLPSGGSTCRPSIVLLLRQARKLYPSADHHLVRCEQALWQNPIWQRSSRRGTGGTRTHLAIAGSRHQVAESLSNLSGLRWEETSSEIYQTVRTVVGTTSQ